MRGRRNINEAVKPIVGFRPAADWHEASNTLAISEIDIGRSAGGASKQLGEVHVR
jgi:hypothetical protein